MIVNEDNIQETLALIDSQIEKTSKLVDAYEDLLNVMRNEERDN